MVGARHLRGTVVSRVRNLLRSGALTKKPVWFDVVEAFPPLVETKVNRRADPGRAPKITYPEDEFRKQFHKSFQTNEIQNLWEGEDHPPSTCDRFVDKCMQLVNQGVDANKAFEEVSNRFKCGALLEEKEEIEQDAQEDLKSSMSIYDILKGSSPSTLPGKETSESKTEKTDI